MNHSVSLRVVLTTLLITHIVFTLAIWKLEDTAVAAVLSGGRLSLSVGVIVAYGSVLWHVGWNRALSTGELLALGIVFAWTSNAVFGAYSLAFQVGWVVASPIITAYATVFGMLSGVIHLACTATEDGRVPLRGWFRGGLWATVGMATALAVYGLYYFRT